LVFHVSPLKPSTIMLLQNQVMKYPSLSPTELPGFWSPMHILLCFMVGSQMYAVVDPTSYLTSKVLWAFAFCGWF
jgi:hypothetical protein